MVLFLVHCPLFDKCPLLCLITIPSLVNRLYVVLWVSEWFFKQVQKSEGHWRFICPSSFLLFCCCCLKVLILYCSIADYECFDNFRCTAKWLSHTDACIHSPPSSLPSRLPRNIEQSSLYSPVGPCWLSILNIAEYTCQSQLPISSSHSSLPSLFAWQPLIHSLSLWACFCFVNKFICIIS